ncbi:4-hydroxythreonine-4-phosphate dehydrogenase PdxA [Thermodesulfobacterium hydrogeniphilum]|uniref:4-hydroxythreonine-4-phosphate dehydrogenase PdxA n=1 Tax=Thermodesulfobacterium hydrogeniphilum TaxID=161156 RepID=UPI00056F22B3|nr:4-hydroxythreonine-4-phosphate dehydrogenase PdxA [Thermodesulfobacterium hydrogeniphilum]
MNSKKFKLAISMGCPAGIGPEIIIKSLNYFKEQPHLLEQILIIGDKKVLSKTAQRLNLEIPKVEILSISELEVDPGKPTIETSKAMAQYVKTAIDLAKKGEIQAIVTGPITKEGLIKAGIPYAGHTDWLAKELGVDEYVMAFYGDKMIVSLVTTHIPLKEVPESINSERIFKVAKLSYEFLNKLDKKDAKIALCGLNPHAGEAGLLGDEEQMIIKEAVDKCKKEKIPIYGPFPSDSLFYWAYKGRYDLVIALYHDQGLIPFKLIHFEDGVNITLGLPIIRTSPCHGTAYDIAGKGIANPTSFVSALKLAYKLLHN